MMRVMITGATGMLGSELCRVFSPDYEVIGICLHKRILASPFQIIAVDITQLHDVMKVICRSSPEIVIHAAAYTDVDGCELNPEKAFLVNAQGTRNVALACQKCRATLVYISTDYVFDGQKNTPYTEEDIPHPINVYGQSKYEGEKEVADLLEKWFIIRTAWLFGNGSRNFVDTILKLAEQKQEIRVVTDQFGSPSYCVDVAREIRRLVLANLEFDLKPQSRVEYGIYHITNRENCCRYEFAQEILKCAHYNSINIVPIVSKEFPRPALRPRYAALSNSRLEATTGDKMRIWQDALREYLQEKDMWVS